MEWDGEQRVADLARKLGPSKMGAWERLRAIADDRERLDDSFEEWERGALQAIRDLASVGRQVRRVPIDLEAYVAWCRERGCRLDSASRAEFVTERLKTQRSPKLDSSSSRSR